MIDMTHKIGRIVSVYFAITGIGFLVSSGYYEGMIATTNSDPILINLSGMVHFFIGMTILVNHFRWNKPLKIAVSLSGVMFFMKGVFLIALPELTLQTGGNPAQQPWVMSIGFIAAGLVMGYFSFLGRPYNE